MRQVQKIWERTESQTVRSAQGESQRREEDVHVEDSSEGPRRSTRSKSKVQKTYTDDSEENLFDLSGEKETARGRSREQNWKG